VGTVVPAVTVAAAKVIVPATVCEPVVALAKDTDPEDEAVTVYVPLYPVGVTPEMTTCVPTGTVMPENVTVAVEPVPEVAVVAAVVVR